MPTLDTLGIHRLELLRFVVMAEMSSTVAHRVASVLVNVVAPDRRLCRIRNVLGRPRIRAGAGVVSTTAVALGRLVATRPKAHL